MKEKHMSLVVVILLETLVFTKLGIGSRTDSSTVVSHIYAYDCAKMLSFILLIRRKSTEFENESNV